MIHNDVQSIFGHLTIVQMEFIPQADAVKKSSRLQKRTTLDGYKNRSKWLHGRTFQVTGFDVVTRDNGADGDYLVLTTAINGNKFDNLFISMILRNQITFDGQEVEPKGSFNNLARQIAEDQTILTDEDYCKKLDEACQGKTLTIKRDVPIKRMARDGSAYPTQLIEININ